MKTLLALLACCIAHVASAQVNWTKDLTNPVIPFGNSGSNRLYHALEPSVMFDEQTGLYRMWFSSSYGVGGLNMSTALSLDGKQWFNYLKNPVLTGSGSGFDAIGMYAGVVIHNGSQYMMYYSGTDGATVQIGLATSPDGIAWTKHPGNPVVPVGSGGSWDANMAIYPRIFFDGSTYHMWYNGRNSSSSAMGYATSPDGVSWTKYPTNPVLTPEVGGWDEDMVVPGSLAKFDSLYVLMYTGASANVSPRLGLAYSADGIQWTKHGAGPVLHPGSGGSWDSEHMGGGSMIVIGGNFHLWYSARHHSSGQWQIGSATSPPTFLTVENPSDSQPQSYSLGQSYPNPFNPDALIQYSLPKQTHVRLAVYDALGQEVAVLIDDVMNAGMHSVRWTADNVPSGTYWYRITTDEFTSTKTMVLLK